MQKSAFCSYFENRNFTRSDYIFSMTSMSFYTNVTHVQHQGEVGVILKLWNLSFIWAKTIFTPLISWLTINQIRAFPILWLTLYVDFSSNSSLLSMFTWFQEFCKSVTPPFGNSLLDKFEVNLKLLSMFGQCILATTFEYSQYSLLNQFHYM